MKYPSVFLTVVIIWVVVDLIALSMGDRTLTLKLYFAAVVASFVLFFIGFWRNK